MKITQTQKDNEQIVLTIDIEEAVWKEQQKKVANDLARNISIPGYRKGKVPYELAIKRINPQDVMGRAMKKMLDSAAAKIIESEEFKKIEDDILDISPSVDITKLSENEIQFAFKYHVYPEVVVDGYKNIRIKTKYTETTDQDVKKEIDGYLSRNSMVVPKEKGAIEKGDIATFDFTGYISGKEFEGGSAKNYELKIGSNQFIPGFEDQMIGMNIGDKKDINVTFPTDYHQKDYAGKPAKFVVQIHSISSVESPELNDEFVKTLKIKDVETVEQLKNFVKENLTKDNKAKFEQDQKVEVYNEINKIVKVDNIPDALIQNEKNKLMRTVEQQTKAYGISLDQYIQFMNLSKEDFEKKQTEIAKNNLKTSMAILKICELEKIEATDAEINEQVEKLANAYGMSKDDLLKNTNGDLAIFESFAVEKKIIDFFVNLK